MRLPGLSLFLAIAALIGATKGASAQYPWCFYDRRTDHLSCYYATWEQCMATLWGIGGVCVQDRFYRSAPLSHPLYAAKKRSRSSTP